MTLYYLTWHIRPVSFYVSWQQSGIPHHNPAKVWPPNHVFRCIVIDSELSYHFIHQGLCHGENGGTGCGKALEVLRSQSFPEFSKLPIIVKHDKRTIADLWIWCREVKCLSAWETGNGPALRQIEILKTLLPPPWLFKC